MKKYLNLFLTAMVMCAAVSMTSCSKDDDPVVNEEPKLVYEDLTIYKTSLTEEVLSYYDIKLQLSNGQKTIETALMANDCEKVDFFVTKALECYVFEIDGVRGVTSVKATVTPKANIEKMLAETTASQIGLGAESFMISAKYYPSKNAWEYPDMWHCSAYLYDPKELLEVVNGKPEYQRMAETLTNLLSNKSKK